ncbi:MAG: M23 family metallopeptidase [Acidimicrobiales bacterium]|nr:M23 family metallopeptidase [Acidimicrobiales bacterium]MDG2216887.1 M23 family metallopeptidase [Acidimicrobiales bacterium]
MSFALLVSAATSGQAQDQIEDLRGEREENRREAALVAAELDGLSAEDAELVVALAAIDSHIELQEAKVAASLEAIDAAEEEAMQARRLAADIGEEMDEVRDRLRRSAVEAFVGTDDRGLAELDVGDLLASATRKSLREQVIGNEYDLVDELRAKEAEQAEAERVAQHLVADVEAERVALEDRLAELDDAKRDAEILRNQVEGRIAEWQAVGAEIEAADREMTREIQQLEAEAERKAEEEEARRRAEEEEARREAEEGDTDSDDPIVVGDFVLTHRPVPGVMTSPFGNRIHPIFGYLRAHKGIDFNGDLGDDIIAGADGVVLTVGWRNGYGNTVVLSHGNGLTTLYAHMSEVGASPGQSVSGGDTIGYVGSTGWSTGPHLHLELRVEGIAVDPGPYLP